MNVIEARRVRHLIIRLDRGEELPATLLRALDEAEARAAWIEGQGSLDAADIALFDQATRTYAKTRRLDGPCNVIGLSGNVALLEGESSLHLSATLARESALGLQLSAGELVWARVHTLELRVTVFDDLALSRAPDDRTGLTQLTVQPGPATQPASATPVPVEPARPAPSAAPVTPTAEPAATAMPQRPAARPRPEEEQHYPDVGDHVTHFHFGECVVLSSDGERIRLRQDRDGRVREVSLTMLRIEAPTVDAESGKRRFLLSRKN